MPTERSAGIIIFRRNGRPKFLLLKPKQESRFWDLPKGNIRKNEEEAAAALREAAEETGLENIQLLDGFQEKINYFYRRAGAVIYKENIFFLAEVGDDQVKLSWEHVEHGWFALDEAKEKLRENTLKILAKAEEFINQKL